MKIGIHPQMFKDATATCMACGATFAIPATVEKQTVESCRLCHPAYTGKASTETKGGRIDRFRKRMAAGKKE